MSDRARAISPLDGRYAGHVGELGEWFSELALVRARCQVELAFVQALTSTGAPGLPGRLTADEDARIEALSRNFGEAEFARVKELEALTRHDVKAVELFLRESLRLERPNLIHLGLTSEDVNNLAYGLMLDGFRRKAQIPALVRLLELLVELAAKWKASPFPARTHGQLATPTTAGKELAVFLHRLLPDLETLLGFRFPGKLNGATGNYSAFVATYPRFDWPRLSEGFVRSLGLTFNPLTTQIESHDGLARYLDLARHTNNIVLDLDLDVWLYVSHGYFRQRTKTGEVGSSTMPHKVNPIRFENSEGNLELSNALLTKMSDKLTRSRMQRDLSDSTVLRNLGVALGHAHLGILEATKGLRELELDPEVTRAELDGHPELLAEPIQTILRAYGADDPYEQMKALTRGRVVSRDALIGAVEALPLPEEARAQCRLLAPSTYLGLAEKLTDEALERARGVLRSVSTRISRG
ncbi:MAG: adenylosuccinate lyase [Deltaproteobacteria bacterium]|nr:adenylosuccinate lyase [Deltaproteobacteria bacterium]